jgi:hypothetical protein
MTSDEINASAALAAEKHHAGASLGEVFALAPPLRVFPKWSPKPNTIDYDIDREDLYQWILAVKKALGPYQCDRCDARKGELWSEDHHTWPDHCINCGDEWPDESCFLTKEAGVFHCCECHHTWRADGGAV